MRKLNILSASFKYIIVSLGFGLLTQGAVAQTQKENKEESTTKVVVRITKDDGQGKNSRNDTTIIIEGDTMVLMGGDIPQEGMVGNCKRIMVLKNMPGGDFNPSDPFPFGMGMTPWGQITKFEIKNKKHGKKITIETNDDMMIMMPPSCPDSRHEKQIKIIKEERK
ncbi:MAG: hypothetical protein WCO63_05115 [Bacteroidota bacterium]